MSGDYTDTEEEISESAWPEPGITIETTDPTDDPSLPRKLADVVDGHWLNYIVMRQLLYKRVSKEYRKMFVSPSDPGWDQRPGQTKMSRFIPEEVTFKMATSQNAMKRFMNRYFILEDPNDQSMGLASLTFINGAGEPNPSWRGLRDIDTVIPWIDEMTVKNSTYSDSIKAFNAVLSHKWDECYDGLFHRVWNHIMKTLPEASSTMFQ